MWRYQRPGFEVLLVEQLQRQQCSSEFCDTVLRSDGVSIPAHSCILSALSSQISHTLSTAPALSPGQKHLLDFQTVGPNALLKLVGFLYTGELQGAEETERQEVMSAVRQLGIGEPVEVAGAGAAAEQTRRREREEGMDEERSKDGCMGGLDGEMPLRFPEEKEVKDKRVRRREGQGKRGRVRGGRGEVGESVIEGVSGIMENRRIDEVEKEGGGGRCREVEKEGGGGRCREIEKEGGGGRCREVEKEGGGGRCREVEKEGGGGRCREIGVQTEALGDKRRESWTDGRERGRGEEDLSRGKPGFALCNVAPPVVSEYIPSTAVTKFALHSTAPAPADGIHLLAADSGMSAATTRDSPAVSCKCHNTLVEGAVVGGAYHMLGGAVTVVGGADPVVSRANPMLGGAKTLTGGVDPILAGAETVMGGANSMLGEADPMVGGTDPMAVPLLAPNPTVSLSHMLLLPAPQDYAPTPSTSLCLDQGDPPPSLPLCAVPLAPQAELVCNETGAGTGLEEGHAGEFRRFEGNIPGFISYFLNRGGSPEEELGQRRGRGGGGCGGGAETCRAGRKRGRRKKGRGKKGRGEKRSEAGWEVVRTRPGNGVWHRGWRGRAQGAGRGKTGRGGGAAGSRSNTRPGPRGRQPIKIRLRRRSEMWELVSVAEEGRVATPRSGVSRGRQTAGHWSRRGTNGRESAPCRALHQDGFPFIKTQRGRARARPLPFPALPHHLFKALTLSPPSDNPLLNSSTPLPPTLGPTLNLSPAPDFLHTLPLPTPIGADESDEQIEKLLEDVMMGLKFLPPTIPVVTETEGSHSNGLSHERSHQPHVEAAPTKVTAAGPIALAETALPLSSPCGTLEDHGNTTTMGELHNILDSFLWTFESQMTTQSMEETAVMEAGNDRNAGNAMPGLCSEPGSCLAITREPSAGADNPHADPNRTAPAMADSRRGDASPVTGPACGPEPGVSSAGVGLQNCLGTGLSLREVHPDKSCPCPESQCVPAPECIVECAPTSRRKGRKTGQVPSKPERPLERAAHRPVGFQHQSFGDSASCSMLQPSLPLPKWLSPHPVALQFPLSLKKRTSANHPMAGSLAIGLQNPQRHNVSNLKNLDVQCGLTQRLAGRCSPESLRTKKRGSCRTMQVVDKKRTVIRRQGHERKRAEEEEEDDDEEEGMGNSSLRRRSLKRRINRYTQELETTDLETCESKAKQGKYEASSATLPGMGVADRMGSLERISSKGGYVQVESGEGLTAGGGVGHSSSRMLNGGTLRGEDVSICTPGVRLIRQLSNRTGGPNRTGEPPEKLPRGGAEKSPRDSAEKLPKGSAEKPPRNIAQKLSRDRTGKSSRDTVKKPPKDHVHKMEELTNRTALKHKSLTVQIRKANVHTQGRGSKGGMGSEGGVKVTEEQSKPRERKERGRQLSEKERGCREERGATVQNSVQRPGGKRKREESASASDVRLRAVHAGKTWNVNEETSLDKPGTNIEPKHKPKSRRPLTGKVTGRGTRPALFSTLQEIRERLKPYHWRERITDNSGERERESEQGEREIGKDQEGERERGSEQDNEWERSEKEQEEMKETEENGGREMAVEERATRRGEGTIDCGKLNDGKEKKITDKTGAAELKERGDEKTLKGGMMDSAGTQVGENQSFGSGEEEVDVYVDGDAGERKTCCAWDTAPNGQPDVPGPWDTAPNGQPDVPGPWDTAPNGQPDVPGPWDTAPNGQPDVPVLQSQYTPVSSRKAPDIGPGDETKRGVMWKQRMASVVLCEKKRPLLRHLATQELPPTQVIPRVTEGSGSEQEEEEVDVLACSPLPLILKPELWVNGLNSMTSSEEEEEGDIDVTGDESD